jgi:hypothetical protein
MLTPTHLSGTSEARKPSHLDKVSNLKRASSFITYFIFHLVYSDIIFTSPVPLTLLPLIPSPSLFCRHAWFQRPCFHCIKFSPSLLFNREDGSSPFGYSSHTHITYISIRPIPVIDLVRNSFDVMRIFVKCFAEAYFTTVSHQLKETQHWELIVLQFINKFSVFYGNQTVHYCIYKSPTYSLPWDIHPARFLLILLLQDPHECHFAVYA